MCRQHCAYTNALTSDFFLEKSLSVLKKTSENESNSFIVRDTHNTTAWIGNRTLAGSPWLFKFSRIYIPCMWLFSRQMSEPTRSIYYYIAALAPVFRVHADGRTYGWTCSESFFERSALRSHKSEAIQIGVFILLPKQPQIVETSDDAL